MTLSAILYTAGAACVQWRMLHLIWSNMAGLLIVHIHKTIARWVGVSEPDVHKLYPGSTHQGCQTYMYIKPTTRWVGAMEPARAPIIHMTKICEFTKLHTMFIAQQNLYQLECMLILPYVKGRKVSLWPEALMKSFILNPINADDLIGCQRKRKQSYL